MIKLRDITNNEKKVVPALSIDVNSVIVSIPIMSGYSDEAKKRLMSTSLFKMAFQPKDYPGPKIN